MGPDGLAADECILCETDDGIYCPDGDFHIDPRRPVPRAVVTHAHSDHARPDCGRYLVSNATLPFLRSRLGQGITARGLKFGERLSVGGVTVSFHPSGHILGAAQVRIANRRQVAVVTGDYKRQGDGTCETFEPVSCDLLITESTFGLPVYRWPPMETVAAQLNRWWEQNRKAGRPSVLFGYALGKSQRMLSLLDPSIGPIYLHGALDSPTQLYRQAGILLPETRLVSDENDRSQFQGAMIMAVPGSQATAWMRRFPDASTAMASGWMAVRGHRRRRSMDRGFLVSDHVDWLELLRTVSESGAQRVWVTHGYADVVARYLQEQGLSAVALRTRYAAPNPESEDSE